MIYLNNDAKKWTRSQRNMYQFNAGYQHASEGAFASLLSKMGIQGFATNVGISPGEAYREMEAETTIELNDLGEFATYAKVVAVSKSVGLGKLDYTYRQGSKQEGGKVSMSGQTGIITDAVEYKNAGTVIPIIDHGTSREWREMLTFGADGFDTMKDDDREAGLVLARTANSYLWDGDSKIVSPDGRSWLGLKLDPSILRPTHAIDLNSSANTTVAIINQVRTFINSLRITNKVFGDIDIGIPALTYSYWESTPFSVNDAGFGTVLSFIKSLAGVKSIYVEPKLTGAREIFMAHFSHSGLHAVTGQAVSNYVKQIIMHNDPFVMVKWMAQGFMSKMTHAGMRNALYATTT